MGTGRLGIARTIAPALGKRSRIEATSTPARSDTTVVGRLTHPESRGATSSSCCGLKPRVTSFGCGPRTERGDRHAGEERYDGGRAADPPREPRSDLVELLRLEAEDHELRLRT